MRIAPDELDICDVDAVHEIHRVGTAFRKAPWYHKLSPKQADDDSGGVFTIRDPKKASARRKLFLHAGSKAMIHEWEDEVSKLVRLTVSKIKRDLKIHGRVDLMKWWGFMTADVMGMFAFGESFRMVETEKVMVIQFCELMMLSRSRKHLCWTIWRLFFVSWCGRWRHHGW